MAEIAIPTSGTIVTWVEFTDSSDTRNVWSMQALTDAGTYYGGFKEPRVVEMGALVRALSDINGTYEGVDFSIVLSDNDRVIRSLLGSPTTKFFLNRSLVVRMIDDASRRLGLEPRTVMRGLVSTYKPLPDLKFAMSAQDVLTRRFSSQVASQAQVPKRAFDAADFPTAPPETLLTPVPVIYGQVSDRDEQWVVVGSQTKFAATANMSTATVGTPGTWNVTYAITLVGEQTAFPPWAPENQQDERLIGFITVPNCVGPDEYVAGVRYTTISWDQPFGYATKIYGRFLDGKTWKGGSRGYLGYSPPVTSYTAPTDRITGVENWLLISNDKFQPPINNMFVYGNFTTGGLVLIDNARGAIQPVYTGPKRFR